jgi:hypothetical protein
MSACLADAVYQLTFIVKVAGEFRVIKRPVADQQGSIGFDKEHRFRGDGIVELFCMLTVIAAYTDYFHVSSC